MPKPSKAGKIATMTDALQAPIFSFPIRVYYADTDAGGVIYHARYFDFFERCRTEWLRQTDCHQHELNVKHQLAFVVRSAQIDYLKPGRLDDKLWIDLAIEKFGRSQIIFRQQARRQPGDEIAAQEILATATVRIVCVDLTNMKSAAIPDWLRIKLEALL